MKNKFIGIVGQGFVGSAIREGLNPFYNIETYDIRSELSTCESLNELVEKTSIIFICLPTPMAKTGECVTTLVEDTVFNIDNFLSN